MYGVVKSNQPCSTGPRRAETRSSRTLLFVSPNNIPECLVHAVEREFPWLTVERAASLGATCIAFQHPILLMLIDAMFFSDVEDFASEFARFHPCATIALMQDDSRRPVPVNEVLASSIVRGILPMNLKLDVWLSVVRLMLHGGEYFPPTMVQSLVRSFPAFDRRRPAGPAQLGRAGEADVDALHELTEREIQILEMVSRGLQNKLIASALHLSENTIKIHLHNIITKLGVHNRTEAAGLFRDGRDTFYGSARPPRASRLPTPPVS